MLSFGEQDLAGDRKLDVAIISAYNDMLSAHQPYETYPQIIKRAVADAGGVAQFAGAVPAMCDGVTQGQAGMELSLFSRDTIAMSSAVGLSHDMFDAVLFMGICDKIVPGLLMSALTFGHLPAMFVPAGPMPSGIPNFEKSRIRQLFAEGKVGREELLAAESASYHSAGTCTFYGTANSNQLLVEIMGLHLPGSSFIHPDTPLRDALTKDACQQILAISDKKKDFRPIGHIVDERSIVNAIVGLLATGGSTNHTMHWVAVARTAGIILTWDDYNDLSEVVPLMTRIYPNGQADINHFQAAGGMAVLIRDLVKGGYLHPDVMTVSKGNSLADYSQEPYLDKGQLKWREAPAESLDKDVLADVTAPFSTNGGLKMLSGNLGRGIIKSSAVKPENRVVEAPAIVFDDQNDLVDAFKLGKLEQDFVAVLRYQGPRACGMPELHKLTPPLGVLQDKGFKVALVTDGRMSGASGKVPSAIHLTPECACNGPLAKVRNGDMIRLDANAGVVEVLVSEEELDARIPLADAKEGHDYGMGRELFGVFRNAAGPADEGACSLTPFWEKF